MKDRIVKINQRLSEIEAELRTAKEVESIEKLSKESTELIEERGRLTAEMAAEARSALNVNAKNIENINERETNLKNMSKREKLTYILGKQARKKEFDAIEKRALGAAVTTTSETYIESSEAEDGVNNGGLFINTSILLDLLKEDKKLSPILNDIAFTSVKGLTQYIYRKSRSKANAKTEGKGTPDGQFEWDKLELTKGYLQLVITITDELRSLTDFDFGAYLYEQIASDLTEDWTYDLIYADGTAGRIKGLTTGAISGAYSGDVIDGLIAAVKKCKGQYRRGAKIYVAQDVYDAIFFSVDANGNFKYPVFNNASGITSLGTIRVEVDENLKDGDFIIGNVSKYFKANNLIPLKIENDRHAREGVTDYIVNNFCATAPFPGAFVYGKKS